MTAAHQAGRPTAQEPGARRILFVLMGTVTTLVLLFGYRTSTPHAAPVSTVAAATTKGGTPGSAAARTYTGGVASTSWGPVQVEITVVGGRITAARAVQVPSGNSHDAEVNSQAVPMLNSEVVAAQSARIDSISGATITSGGYQASLQSALDAAAL